MDYHADEICHEPDDICREPAELFQCPKCHAPVFYIVKMDRHGDPYDAVCLSCGSRQELGDLPWK